MLALGLALSLLQAPASGGEDPVAPPAAPPPAAPPQERSAALARAVALYIQCSALRRDGDYAAAVPLARESLALRERHLGAEHGLVAMSLLELGMLEQLQGAHPAAQACYERALAIQERLLGPNSPLLASTRSNLGILLMVQGAREQGRAHLEEALAICSRLLVNPQVRAELSQHLASSVISNLALALLEQGELVEARRLLLRALDLAGGEGGSDTRLRLQALNNLCVVLTAQGDLVEAQRIAELALAMGERMLPPEHPDLALGLVNLGALLHGMGADAEARPLLDRALAIQEAALGPHHHALGRTLSARCIVSESLGLLAEVHAGLLRSLSVREKAFGSDHPEVATALNNLAAFLVREGDLRGARLHFERALAITEKMDGPGHPRVATLLDNLGSLLSQLGEHARARELLERAVAIQERVLDPAHPDATGALHTLAVVLAAQGESVAARECFRQALVRAEDYARRQLGGLGSRQRRILLRQMRRFLDSWVLSPVRDGDPAHAEVLRSRGLASRMEAAERRLVRRTSDDERQIHADLLAAQQRLSHLANSVPPASRPGDRARWQREYAQASLVREQRATAWAQRLAPLRHLLEPAALGLEVVRAHVEPGTVLVDFLRAESQYVAWVIRDQGGPARVDLGPAAVIEAACAAFLVAIQAGGEAHAEGKALRALVWEPLEAHLGEHASKVVLCPDSALAGVPLAALPGRTRGRYLIDEFEFVHVTCLQDLVPVEGSGVPGRGALLVGGVDYGKAAVPAAAPSSIGDDTALTQHAPRGKDTLRPLPQTRAEIEGLRALFGEQEDVVLLEGPGATEASIRERAPGRGIVHIATHGHVREDLLADLHERSIQESWISVGAERQLAAGHDPLLLSGLALAGANVRDGGGGDDGILTALEASYLDLEGVDLVTLSACDTARGTAASGEGVQGLVSAFQLAGARTVLASLWRVTDEATRLLMEDLYARLLRKQDPPALAAALRQAALALRDRVEPDGTRRFAAPRYWAAFVAYGR